MFTPFPSLSSPCPSPLHSSIPLPVPLPYAGVIMETQKIPGNLHLLRIFPKTLEPTIGRPAVEVASSDLEEIKQWQKEIEAVRVLIETQQRDQHRQELIMKKKAQNKKIALEMSNLVTYCRPVHFQFDRDKGIMQGIDLLCRHAAVK